MVKLLISAALSGAVLIRGKCLSQGGAYSDQWGGAY